MAIFNQLFSRSDWFALPVMMIEGPINAVAVSGLAHSSKWLTIIYGGLMAGLVEETTRYVVFKVLAKKKKVDDI